MAKGSRANLAKVVADRMKARQKKLYQLIVFDIDGVLTDGTIIIDANGGEWKRIPLRALDALSSLKASGLLIAAITGENTDICRFFEKRVAWDAFMTGIKDKGPALAQVAKCLGIPLEQTVYIGDGKYDAPAIRLAGLGVCPRDACLLAKNNADLILGNGGGACVEEIFEIVSVKNRHPSWLGFTAVYALKKVMASRFLSLLKMPWKLMA